MGNQCSPVLWRAIVAGVSIAAALAQAHAGNIGGETASSTASAPPLASHPLSRDERNVTTTYGIAARSSSFLIKESAAEFPGYNFVFAGIGTIGKHFTPIDESAFEISTYTPWVVNSPDLMSNGGTTCNRGVTNQDSGGVNILIDYIPTGSDPTTVNFLQAFEVRINGGKPIIAMDNGGKGGPPLQRERRFGDRQQRQEYCASGRQQRRGLDA